MGDLWANVRIVGLPGNAEDPETLCKFLEINLAACLFKDLPMEIERAHHTLQHNMENLAVCFLHFTDKQAVIKAVRSQQGVKFVGHKEVFLAGGYGDFLKRNPTGIIK